MSLIHNERCNELRHFLLVYFPLIIAAGAFGWIAYDKRKERKRLHPGE